MSERYSGSLNGVMLEEKKDPMSGGSANVKTDFRVQESLDHEGEPTSPLKAEFAYPGTDKGVQK